MCKLTEIHTIDSGQKDVLRRTNLKKHSENQRETNLTFGIKNISNIVQWSKIIKNNIYKFRFFAEFCLWNQS